MLRQTFYKNLKKLGFKQVAKRVWIKKLKKTRIIIMPNYKRTITKKGTEIEWALFKHIALDISDEKSYYGDRELLPYKLCIEIIPFIETFISRLRKYY